jgi:DNA-directed RNA polymerase specialized sigma24 family protein
MTTVEDQTVTRAQERLVEWAEWLRTAASEDHLGYPRAAAFAQPPGRGVVEVSNTRAEEVEAVMTRMKVLRPTLFAALVHWYVLEHPLEAAARACGCSVTVYRDRRRMGEMFVAGALFARVEAIGA